ncbi:MAG: hypothetical protein ACI9FN_001446 [Saprospiraceae bacterium]|jgi:hypothetical protein
MIFDEDHSIPLAGLDPNKIIGFASMYPTKHYTDEHAVVSVRNGKLVIESKNETQTGIWFGGFNPFATYTIDLDSCADNGEVGFQFSDADDKRRFFILLEYDNSMLTGVKLRVIDNGEINAEESIAVNVEEEVHMKGEIILQMLGSGLTFYLQDQGLPKVIGQSNFNTYLDLRKKEYLYSFQSQLFVQIKEG